MLAVTAVTFLSIKRSNVINHLPAITECCYLRDAEINPARKIAVTT